MRAAPAPLPSPHIRLRRRRRITTLLLLAAAAIIPRRSLSFSTPPSLLLSSPPPPPSLLPSFTPPPAEKSRHPPFLPTAPSITSALLALKRPPHLHLLSSSPRPGRASFHLQPASPCQRPAWPTTISPVATHTHTCNPQTYTHTDSPDTPAYYSPKHTWTRTITLAQLYKQPQAKFPSVAQSESHTIHASISRSQPHIKLLPGSILHTSSDLHEPRQLQQHPLDQTHCRQHTPPSRQYQLHTPLPPRD